MVLYHSNRASKTDPFIMKHLLRRRKEYRDEIAF